MHGSNKEQAAPEILRLRSFKIHASQTISFIVRHKVLAISDSESACSSWGILNWHFSFLHITVLISSSTWFFSLLYKPLCLKGFMKEIIKKYTEENCLSRRGRNPRCCRELPQTHFWMIINFFLTIILWCCLCLITHVLLTCVTGVIWRAVVMIKLWKCQLLPTCSSKHRAGSVRRQLSLD